ncbi:MAG: TRZ/ATZ family hydrolase [Gammaproteobacteria bacterium]|nr:TRZ/ATZ family hydrolase [Gammaproteobacteria bacterium]
MRHVDTLIYAGWVIPAEPDNMVYEHHAVVIHEGKILAILPSNEAVGLFSARITHRLPTHALIPGLINTHTHAAMNLLRGYADDLPLMEWLNTRIWPAEKAWVSPAFVEDGTRLAIAEMLLSGITCFNDMYFFPDIAAKTADDAGIRATIGLIVIDFPTVWAKNAEEYLLKGHAVYEQYRHHPLVRTAFAPHAPYSVSNAPLEQIAGFADRQNIRVHMHVHETNDEIGHGEENHGERPLARLDKAGLLSEHFLAVHMTQVKDEEIARLAETGTHVVHCPESNMKLASGFCPVQKLLSAGVNVALGTDSAASNDDLDILGEMRTAALLAKAVSGDASAVPVAQALRMATLNGAKALGIDNVTGSLVTGKSADIVAIDMNNLETQPVYNPLSQLVYTIGRSQVTDVWVAGRHLVKSRTLTSLNLKDIQAKTNAWREKIATDNK